MLGVFWSISWQSWHSFLSYLQLKTSPCYLWLGICCALLHSFWLLLPIDCLEWNIPFWPCLLLAAKTTRNWIHCCLSMSTSLSSLLLSVFPLLLLHQLLLILLWCCDCGYSSALWQCPKCNPTELHWHCVILIIQQQRGFVAGTKHD